MAHIASCNTDDACIFDCDTQPEVQEDQDKFNDYVEAHAYLPTYLQLFYYSKVRAAEHYCEANRGGLGRCPRASAVRQDTGTPLLLRGEAQ